MAKPIHISSDNDLTVIRARFAGETSWIEFRSDLPYHLWDESTPASEFHDLLEGWHACILHAGDSFNLLDKHPDYERVVRYIELTSLP